jgi:dethiobiotin synthetase
MGQGFFITGTDTNIGKTWTTIALMSHFRQAGLQVAGMKPVAAGCAWQAGRLVNEDALLMQTHGMAGLAYEQINPYAFAAAVSPHLAAEGVEVQLDTLLATYRNLAARADVVLVEGAGGWLSPLSQTLDNAGLAQVLQLPVLLVVGLRLGCINQARLSMQAIQHSGLRCAGWIAVSLEADMPGQQGNVAFLQQQLAAPLLAVLPHLPAENFDLLAAQFKSGELLT